MSKFQLPGLNSNDVGVQGDSLNIKKLIYILYNSA